MILPIIAYGDPVLRKTGKDITNEYPNLDALLENMFETMYEARGIGLASPQVGVPILLFIVDATPFEEDEELTEEERAFLSTFKQVFINAKIIKETGDEWAFNEGCLSIPDIREDIFRNDTIKIEYLDENFEKYTKKFHGIVARIIQHEYDHMDGLNFTNRVSKLKMDRAKKRLKKVQKKLDNSYLT